MRVTIESYTDAKDVVWKTIVYLRGEGRSQDHCIESCACDVCLSWRILDSAMHMINKLADIENE